MPEGPELFKASVLVNSVCKDRVFTGKILKSAVSTKNPAIPTSGHDYTIRAESRGKEMALVLSPHAPEGNTSKKKCSGESKPVRILFRFGMSGRFTFCAAAKAHKHAHLKFFTKEKPKMVLSFVDVRRFGRWEITNTWSTDRGPDPVFEYGAFRSNILDNLEDKIFNKPLCEVMHNQRFFNGIGNYLRAEIIFRAGVAPFVMARTVLGKLKVKEEDHKESKENGCEEQDILQLCRTVPQEVMHLPGAGYDPDGGQSDYTAFEDWLQCYYNPAMRNLVDHDGRTMWFKGEAGPLAPKGAKSRTMKSTRKRKHTETRDVEQNSEEVATAPKKEKKNRAQPRQSADSKGRGAKTDKNNANKPQKQPNRKRKQNTKTTRQRQGKKTRNTKNPQPRTDRKKTQTTNSIQQRPEAAQSKRRQSQRQKAR